MTVTISSWMIPVLLTVMLWVAVVAWPIRPSRGDYDFGPPFEALFHALAGVIGTLVIWLVYFALMFWIS